MTFDRQMFRQALGRFATGVTVVTGECDDGVRLGVTVSSFNSVSLDPPLVLFSLDRSASSAARWETISHYAVNVLDQSQLTVCQQFARAGTDKWQGVDYHKGETGAPVLPGSLATYECRQWASYDGGDHIIFVGEVLHLETRADGRPLLFHNGAFKAVSDLPTD